MISYIQFKNAPRIGSLELDFQNNYNEPCNTIVLAGENGCGKTSILNLISQFLEGAFLSEDSFVDKVVYNDISGSTRVILRQEEALHHTTSYDSIQDFYYERYKLSEQMPYDIRNNPIVFSEARTGFEVNAPDGSEMAEIESGQPEYEKKGSDYSGLVRLLNDLEVKDNNSYIRFAKSNPCSRYDEYISQHSNIIRFKRAFENMFGDIKYIGKSPIPEENSIYFERQGIQFDINDLSTGEKQIVFRGADLLYHVKEGATVIVDEPELSLHPKWQMKILEYYRDLLSDGEGRQIAQLIVATHSPYVIQSATRNPLEIKTLITHRDRNNIVADGMRDTLVGTATEINYLAFGIDKKEYHTQLFSEIHRLLQRDNSCDVNERIKSFDIFIMNHKLFDENIHKKVDESHGQYYTLPVYIRNAIDHPDSGREFSDDDLSKSIDLLRSLLKDIINQRKH